MGTLILPQGTKPNNVHAKMENGPLGLLNVAFPKAQPQQEPQRITIQWALHSYSCVMYGPPSREELFVVESVSGVLLVSAFKFAKRVTATFKLLLHFLRKRENANDEWIHALEIPLTDIQRLSLRPLKWLRFAAFAVLGSKGDLYDEPGPDHVIVDYDIVSLNDDANYFFIPNESYSLIDYEALNDQLTSSSVTPRRTDFRERVAERDGDRCVITLTFEDLCNAAHIIPHAKGNRYIEFVIAQRRGLYQNWNPTNDIDIDMTENGMLVTKDIHAQFGAGHSAFLKTPNFALNPDDIPRVEDGEIPALRATLQHLQPPDRRDPVPQRDVVADWFGQEDAPPRLILDFMYGVALIKHWHAPGIQDQLNFRYEEFALVQRTVQPPTHEDEDGSGDDGVVMDHSSDSDFICATDRDDPSGSHHDEHKKPARYKGRRRIRQKSKDSELSRAMDLTLELSMFIAGCSAGTTVAMMLQQWEEEAEVRSRQIAREKVEGWLDSSPDALMAMD